MTPSIHECVVEDCYAKFQTSAPLRLVTCIALWLAIPPLMLSAFKSQHHGKITREVLEEATLTRTIDGHTLKFQPQAIREIVDADVDQDEGVARCALGLSPVDPFADSANHFDSENLTGASTRVRTRMDNSVKALLRSTPDGGSARQSLGQVLHAAQDYYAHSNWVEAGPGWDNRLAV